MIQTQTVTTCCIWGDGGLNHVTTIGTARFLPKSLKGGYIKNKPATMTPVHSNLFYFKIFLPKLLEKEREI